MRIVPQFDTYPRLVNFGQSASGKAVLLGVFALGLVAGHERLWVEMTAAVALMTYFPAQRRLICLLYTSLLRRRPTGARHGGLCR